MIPRRLDNEVRRDHHVFSCRTRNRKIEIDVFADVSFVVRTIATKTIGQRIIDTKAVE